MPNCHVLLCKKCLGFALWRLRWMLQMNKTATKTKLIPAGLTTTWTSLTKFQLMEDIFTFSSKNEFTPKSQWFKSKHQFKTMNWKYEFSFKTLFIEKGNSLLYRAGSWQGFHDCRGCCWMVCFYSTRGLWWYFISLWQVKNVSQRASSSLGMRIASDCSSMRRKASRNNRKNIKMGCWTKWFRTGNDDERVVIFQLYYSYLWDNLLLYLRMSYVKWPNR